METASSPSPTPRPRITLTGSPAPEKDFSHTFSPEKDQPLNKDVQLWSSVNVISALSRGRRAEGEHFTPSQPPGDTTRLHSTAGFLCRQREAGRQVLGFKPSSFHKGRRHLLAHSFKLPASQR